MGNPFVHVELMTTDPLKAKAFYGDLFDWKLEDMPTGNGPYLMINVGSGTGGGMMKNPMPGAPSNWMAYVEVVDVNESNELAEELGGKVVKETTEVPDKGWFSVITDPTGAMLGLWQSKK